VTGFITSHSSRTNNSWLFAPSSLILANNYLPLNGALYACSNSCNMKTLLKYENFLSLLTNLTIVIVIGIAIVSVKNMDSVSALKLFKAFGYCFSGLLVMCLFFALPYDLFVLRKDKSMCRLIQLDYDKTFLYLEKVKKEAIRKKFKSWSTKRDGSNIDWLNLS
jgi:hypothetical protein